MLKLLSLKSEAFGLDISDFSLKIVKLKKRGCFFDLVCLNQTAIKPGIVIKGEIKKPDKLAAIIKKAIKEVKGEKLGTNNAIISLPEEKGFLQIIKMPRLSEEDLKSAIIFEAENHIPLPIEDVYLDYQLISTPESKSNDCNVLMVAFPKKIIDSYVSCLEKANIKPIVLETESLAISRALIKDTTISQPILLIDFGANRSIFIIFADSSIVFTFSIPVSSQGFTEAVARSMKVDLVRAEKLKVEHGLKYGLEETSDKTAKDVFEAIVPSLTDLTEQIKKYFAYYETHMFYEYLPSSSKKSKNSSLGKSKIEKILVCGAGSKLKGLSSYLSNELNMPVLPGDPWVNIKVKKLPYPTEEYLSYATALGLALKGIKGK